MPVPTHSRIRKTFGVGTALAFSFGCGGDGGTEPPGDEIPPSAVQGLTLISVLDTEITLRWASPGDDDVAGTASRYDIRYSSVPINGDNFLAAIEAPSPPTPLLSGSTQTHTIAGLARGRWYFALRSSDEVPNWSPLSNTVTVVVGDSIAPSAVKDLVASSLDEESVELTWTAPGDDGDDGASDRYEVRYAMDPLSEETWESATVVADVPEPSTAGSRETFLVSSLSRDETFYFALKSIDDGANWSVLSNVASATTRADTIAPAVVVDLAVHSFTGRTATLTWTAPGDDGMDGIARMYDLRYSETEITMQNFEDATVVEGVSSPGRPGEPSSFTVSGLEPLSEYFFAMRTADEVPNWSSISNVTRMETSSAWQLTFSPDDRNAFDPDWSADGSTIVFSGTIDGQSDLYLIAAEGGEPIRLTDTPEWEQDSSWSPDGKRVVFTYYLGESDPPVGELRVMDAVPESESSLLATHDWGVGRPCWSPDGSEVAYQDHPLASIFTESTIFSIPAEGGNPRVLVNHGLDWGNHSPAWSPDGTRMVIMSTRNFDWNLWVVPLAGGDWTPLTDEPNTTYFFDSDWSPDGSDIACVRYRGGNSRILRIPVSGGTSEELTDASADSYRPRWSPDGSRIAYSSNRSGKSEVWIQIVE